MSKQWHALLSDDLTWKKLCEKHSYRRLSGSTTLGNPPSVGLDPSLYNSVVPFPRERGYSSMPSNPSGFTSEIAPQYNRNNKRHRPKATSYKSHFKQRYMVETAWRSGGKVIARHITPDQGVVTALHLTPDYIVIALDNAKIHVFDADGPILRTLSGHVMGVWAMVPWGKILVSGGCDRDVRVWDMETGYISRTATEPYEFINCGAPVTVRTSCAVTHQQCAASR